MLEQFEQFTQWLFGHVLGWANIIQIPALVLTAGIAWLLCRPVRAWLTGRLNQVRTSSHHDWLAQHHTWVIDRLIPLITPIAWVTGLWISVSVAEQAGWPNLKQTKFLLFQQAFQQFPPTGFQEFQVQNLEVPVLWLSCA